MNIINKIKSLHNARVESKSVKAAMDTLLAEVKATETYKGYEQTYTAHTQTLNTLDAYLRRLALRAARMFKNKKPFPGVEIKDYSMQSITDPNKALAWCLEHKMFLAVDEKAFLKYIETMYQKKEAPLPDDIATFAKVWKEPKATIATDLSKVLE